MTAEKASTNGGAVDNPVTVDTSSPKKLEITQGRLSPPCSATNPGLSKELHEEASVAHTAPTKSPADHQARDMSPTSEKRSLLELPDESTSKRSKLESPAPSPRFPSPPNVPATSVDKETWEGYCEIESDPAYFSVILREIGIQDVNVHELHMMDPQHLITLPPIYGLVLLFRHREFDQHNQQGACPDNVWFANQMPAQNSCATLAMIHTLLNVADPEIDIGEHMRQFKDFTKNLTPLQRGQAFAVWKFVKRIHNSFAKKMDMLENDKYIAAKAAKAAKADKDKVAALKKPAETKKAPRVQTKSRSRTARRNSEDSNASNDSVEAFEANAHHYIAFVPIDGQVWKLDGMDKQPTLMGEYDKDQGEMWVDAVSDRINTLIGAGDNDYGIFAITQSPLVALRNSLCEADNTIQRVDTRLATLSTDWRDFLDEDYREPPSPSFIGSFSEEQRAANPIPGSIKAAIDKEDLPQLLIRHRKLVAEMRRLIVEFEEEKQDVEKQTERAAQRRFDYGPAIQAWVGMLAENGFLEAEINDFEEKK
jgi:ubiquitin carboxyl-terminal hydrolase L5